MLSTPNIRPRYHVYVLTIPTVPVGGVRDVPLPLDSDAAFSLRSWKVRNTGNLGALVGARFRNADGAFVQAQFVSTDVYALRPGERSYPSRLGLTLAPELLYPAQGVIRVDIENGSGAPLTNVQVIFRGSKLYDSGRPGPPAFPREMRVLPFVQHMAIRNVPPVGSVLQTPVFVEQEADYVFRGAVCDWGTLGSDGGPVRGTLNADTDVLPFGAVTDCSAQLLDQDLKPYSNAPLPLWELFGGNQPFPSVALGGQDDPALWRLGLFTPQIYVPRLEALYVSIWRNDPPSRGPAVLNVRFHGLKVYPV